MCSYLNCLTDYPKSAAEGHMIYIFQGTHERVRNSRGKRAISVRATEVLLYMETQHIMAHDLIISQVKRYNRNDQE